MPPKKQSTRKRAAPSDDEQELESSAAALEREADEIQTSLDERAEKIRTEHLSNVNDAKRRCKGHLAALSTKVNHAREEDLSTLANLLERRQATESKIAAKLITLQSELNTFRRYFGAGYDGVKERSAQKLAVCTPQSNPADELVKEKKSRELGAS